ncbi:MAG: OmpA family protein [Flavobacteriaceae bacterium]|nr:OmpA family protein [Flavobacteriaceae bacterium]
MKVIRFFAVLIILFISNNVISQENNKSDCTQIANGRLTDEFSNSPIENVTVEVRDLNERLIHTDITNSNGNYHLILPCNQQYIILFSKKGYITSTTQIETTKTNKKIQRRDIILHLKICNQTINGIILNSKTNNPVENVSIIILKDEVELNRFDNLAKGTFRYSAECHSQYKIKVSAPNFGFITKLFKTTDVNNEPFDLIFSLDPVINNNNVVEIEKKKEIKEIVVSEVFKEILKEAPVSKEKNLELNNVKFKLNKSNVSKNIAIELDKIVQLMNANPLITVELNAHTDSRGLKTYNQALTDARAQSMVSYLLSNGIDATRVSGKGFGETKPLNKCTKKRHCSEVEHQKNKRIEFIILNNESN